MVQPIDYTIDIQNPFVAGIQGLQYGDMMRQVQEGFAQREAQAQRQQTFQQDMQQLSQMGGAKQYSDMILKYPELKDQLTESYSMLSDAEKQSKFNFGAKVLSALKTGNPNVAIDLLNQQADAEENAGKKDDASATRTLAELGKSNPNTLQTIVGINLASDPTGQQLLESVTALELAPSQLQESQAQADIASAEAASAPEKFSSALQKTQLELKQLQENNGLDIAKIFEFEEKLRKENQTRNKVYDELGATLGNIQASAQAKNGPGDVALITGFMKMLDPGSVVRETEFATARDTAGLYQQLKNNLSKVESGQFLSDGQRKQFTALAQQYFDAAKKKSVKDKNALMVVAKNYKLNPENIFGPETTPEGAPSPTTTPPVGATPSGRSYLKYGNP